MKKDIQAQVTLHCTEIRDIEIGEPDSTCTSYLTSHRLTENDRYMADKKRYTKFRIDCICYNSKKSVAKKLLLIYIKLVTGRNYRVYRIVNNKKKSVYTIM